MDSRQSKLPSRGQLEDQAAAFLAHRDSGQWTADDQARLERWLAESTAHRVEFLRLEAAWEEAHRLQVLSPGRPRGTVPPSGEWRRSPFFGSQTAGPIERAAPLSRRRRPLWFATAATILLALGLASFVALHPGGQRYSTPIGGVASVPLRDGSHITLNTDSQVRVDLTPTERRIDLDQGEAFFEVAKDPARPFVVRVGDKRVVAVGTKFSVSRDNDDVRVVVTEGIVRFESATAPLHVEEEGAGTNQRASDVSAIPLTAGTVAQAHDRNLFVQATSLPRAEEILSWREGYLTFHETVLADAIAQFNRYNLRQITIDDPTIASIRISGSFRATNAEAFVRLLENGYGIHAHTTEDQTTLSKP